MFLLKLSIVDLGELKAVGGSLVAFLCDTIESLGNNLKKVSGHLDLRSSAIKSLGSLEYIGGNLILDKNSKLEDLGNLKYVGGEIAIATEEQYEMFGDTIRRLYSNKYILKIKDLKDYENFDIEI